ncbi:uncharacterized protein LOC127082662 [Lathyrus oleraceus]|uniref:uncharacterized protein LOC127082662 n=1 Tax=Pisum sativum TaxID=3888 RepID=UPI0021D306D5|nr:uncharacterized protein LOC127082662 [Pisum sativum]
MESDEVKAINYGVHVESYGSRHVGRNVEIVSEDMIMKKKTMLKGKSMQSQYSEAKKKAKSAFMHGDLMEDVNVNQPLGYEKGGRDNVYKLRKELYGLRQALRVWLNKSENEKPVDNISYKQIVGSSMYFLATRLDFAYSVCLVARYMERPTEIHLVTTKVILRYLKGTMNPSVLYKMNDEMILQGWSDSDYAGDNDDRKSTIEYVFKLGSGL